MAHAYIDAMDYGQIQLSIALWWGPGTVAQNKNSPLKWTIYHKDKRSYNPTPEELCEDFDYLKKWFAWHKNNHGLILMASQ